MLRAMKKAENIRQVKAQPTGATVTGLPPLPRVRRVRSERPAFMRWGLRRCL